MQYSLVQRAEWRTVGGTGSFDGLGGGGSMVATFEPPDTGGEIFTGTVGR